MRYFLSCSTSSRGSWVPTYPPEPRGFVFNANQARSKGSSKSISTHYYGS